MYTHLEKLFAYRPRHTTHIQTTTRKLLKEKYHIVWKWFSWKDFTIFNNTVLCTQKNIELERWLGQLVTLTWSELLHKDQLLPLFVVDNDGHTLMQGHKLPCLGLTVLWTHSSLLSGRLWGRVVMVVAVVVMVMVRLGSNGEKKWRRPWGMSVVSQRYCRTKYSITLVI